MDAIQFDNFTRSLSALVSRRRGLGVLATLGFGAAAENAEAGKGKKKKKRKKEVKQSGAMRRAPERRGNE